MGQTEISYHLDIIDLFAETIQLCGNSSYWIRLLDK